MGSKIAFEMARRLEAADEAVESLTLVDIPAVVPEGTEDVVDPEIPDLSGLDPAAVNRHLAVWRANREASRRWRPRPYGGSAVLWVAEEGLGAGAEDPTLGWGEVVEGGVRVVYAPGDHFTVLRSRAPLSSPSPSLPRGAGEGAPPAQGESKTWRAIPLSRLRRGTGRGATSPRPPSGRRWTAAARRGAADTPRAARGGGCCGSESRPGSRRSGEG